MLKLLALSASGSLPPLAMFVILAADTVDVLSGGAGWVGTGLLGSVLAWLLFAHLPAKDRQVKELIDGRDALVRDQAIRHRDQIKDMVAQHEASFALAEKDRRADFQGALKIVVDHCDKEVAMLREFMARQMSETTAALNDVREGLEGVREAYLKQPPREPQP